MREEGTSLSWCPFFISTNLLNIVPVSYTHLAAKADKVRKEPLRCILNGLGKDAAQIISRINGFTYVPVSYTHLTTKLSAVIDTTAFAKEIG